MASKSHWSLVRDIKADGSGDLVTLDGVDFRSDHADAWINPDGLALGTGSLIAPGECHFIRAIPAEVLNDVIDVTIKVTRWHAQVIDGTQAGGALR